MKYFCDIQMPEFFTLTKTYLIMFPVCTKWIYLKQQMLSPLIHRYRARCISFITDSETCPLFPYTANGPVVHVFAANQRPAAAFIKDACLHGKAASAPHQTQQKAGPAVHPYAGGGPAFEAFHTLNAKTKHQLTNENYQ